MFDLFSMPHHDAQGAVLPVDDFSSIENTVHASGVKSAQIIYIGGDNSLLLSSKLTPSNIGPDLSTRLE
jgi:hypothetical protein